MLPRCQRGRRYGENPCPGNVGEDRPANGLQALHRAHSGDGSRKTVRGGDRETQVRRKKNGERRAALGAETGAALNPTIVATAMKASVSGHCPLPKRYRVRQARNKCRAGQAADQSVRGTRRQSEVPGDPVPRDGAEDAVSDSGFGDRDRPSARIGRFRKRLLESRKTSACCTRRSKNFSSVRDRTNAVTRGVGRADAVARLRRKSLLPRLFMTVRARFVQKSDEFRASRRRRNGAVSYDLHSAYRLPVQRLVG